MKLTHSSSSVAVRSTTVLICVVDLLSLCLGVDMIGVRLKRETRSTDFLAESTMPSEDGWKSSSLKIKIVGTVQ